jgi:uncharacterized membrane protein YdjX (TVP38/TMEM64 family)
LDSPTDAADAAAPGTAAPPRSKTRLILFILIGLALLAAVILGGRQIAGYIPRFAAWVASLGAWGPVVFILGYAVAAIAFVPGLLLTLAAGAIFGLVKGTIYTLIGATLGASGAFLVARYVARGAIERRISSYPKFAAIDKAVGREGFKIVALLRLSPVFPFNLLNYALGLTKVRFLPYLAACAAMLPGTLLYVYYGKALGSLAALASGGKAQKGPEFYVFLGIGLLATIVVTTFVTRLAGKALRQQIDEPAENRHV